MWPGIRPLPLCSAGHLGTSYGTTIDGENQETLLFTDCARAPLWLPLPTYVLQGRKQVPSHLEPGQALRFRIPPTVAREGADLFHFRDLRLNESVKRK